MSVVKIHFRNRNREEISTFETVYGKHNDIRDAYSRVFVNVCFKVMQLMEINYE